MTGPAIDPARSGMDGRCADVLLGPQVTGLAGDVGDGLSVLGGSPSVTADTILRLVLFGKNREGVGMGGVCPSSMGGGMAGGAGCGWTRLGVYDHTGSGKAGQDGGIRGEGGVHGNDPVFVKRPRGIAEQGQDHHPAVAQGIDALAMVGTLAAEHGQDRGIGIGLGTGVGEAQALVADGPACGGEGIR